MRYLLPIFHNARRSTRRSGFTLIEAAIVTVIIGVGVVALLQFLAAGTVANTESAQLTTAINLANNIRERTQTMTFDQTLALNGQTYSPVIDARGQTQSGFPNWTQKVEIIKVDPNRLTLAVPSSTDTPMARVKVQVLHKDTVVYESAWLVVRTG